MKIKKNAIDNIFSLDAFSGPMWATTMMGGRCGGINGQTWIWYGSKQCVVRYLFSNCPTYMDFSSGTSMGLGVLSLSITFSPLFKWFSFRHLVRIIQIHINFRVCGQALPLLVQGSGDKDKVKLQPEVETASLMQILAAPGNKSSTKSLTNKDLRRWHFIWHPNISGFFMCESMTDRAQNKNK